MQLDRLFHILTALSIRLQLREASRYEELFGGDWERQIAKLLGLADEPEEFKAAIAELDQTLSTPGNRSGGLRDNTDSVREIADLLNEAATESYACDLHEFGRTCEEASSRIRRYQRSLENLADVRF